ncbi:MAG: bifunctional hydroxymethylpyrimidine kinase/phosphomethylpyrimidine kinase [Butyrivibrio sp.]|nr:bifunctional hydroxymethylpyrimidine kinase/phosphomethylpyrimidine kinase [Butyrivibrio sp.]
MKGPENMRVAAVNDLSSFGKCSLIADISVLTSMGIEVCPVPTAVLTAQTGFPSYYMHDTGDMVGHCKEEWNKMGVTFDGVLTGYMPSEQVADSVLDFVISFAGKDNVLVVDPVMGDGGRCYSNFSEKFFTKIKKLAAIADMITPNLTELLLLAGEDPKRAELGIMNEKDAEEIIEIANKVRSAEGQSIVVTGIPGNEGELCNLVVYPGGTQVIKCKSNGKSYSGTGDLFAAFLLGNILNGKDIVTAVSKATELIGEAIGKTASTDRNYGVDFEKILKSF